MSSLTTKLAATAASLAIAGGAMAAVPTSASAAVATRPGWHVICANTVSVFNNGQIGVAYGNDDFYIDHIAGDHAWGFDYIAYSDGTQQRVGYGWVYNKYFC